MLVASKLLVECLLRVPDSEPTASSSELPRTLISSSPPLVPCEPGSVDEWVEAGGSPEVAELVLSGLVKYGQWCCVFFPRDTGDSTLPTIAMIILKDLGKHDLKAY